MERGVMVAIARDSAVTEPALDSLQVGAAHPLVSARKAEVTSEMLESVNRWNEKYSTLAGYRTGSSYAPGQMQESIEVSSALQLPGILARLHGPDSSSIRLQFPKPDSSDPHNSEIRVEQEKLHKFLQESHGKELSQLLQEVEALIDQSVSFKVDRNGTVLSHDFSAKQWIQATVGDKLEQIAKLPQKLDVSDVVEIGRRKIDNVKGELDVALKESVESGRGLIITLPNNPAKVNQLREVLRQIVDARTQTDGLQAEKLARIEVWVGPTKNSIDSGPVAGAPCEKIKRMSLADFFDDQGSMSQVSKSAKKEHSTVSEDSQILPVTAQAEVEVSKATVVDEPEPVVVVAQGVVSAEANPLCWSHLVLPASEPHWTYTTHGGVSTVESESKT